MPNLEHIENFLKNPGLYQDWVYGADPDTYTAVPVYKSFRELLKRDPTPQELAIYQPLVVSLGHQGAVSQIAQYAQQEENTPEKKRQREEAELAKKVPENTESVAAMFKDVLGRDATKAEVDHFAKLKASGMVDDYTLSEALKTLPEYTSKQDLTERERLRGELSGADTKFFEQNIMPSIQSTFAQQGRTIDSTGFASALANSAKGLNDERERYLAGIGREDYTNNRQFAINQYLNNQNRGMQLQDYRTARGDQMADMNQQRFYQVQDYGMQKQAYEEYLRNYGKRKGGGLLGGATGAMSGAAAGAPLGPWGAGAGAIVGGLGGYFG